MITLGAPLILQNHLPVPITVILQVQAYDSKQNLHIFIGHTYKNYTTE